MLQILYLFENLASFSMSLIQNLHKTSLQLYKSAGLFIFNLRNNFRSRKKKLDILKSTISIFCFGKDLYYVAHKYLYGRHVESQEHFKPIGKWIVGNIFKEPRYRQSIPSCRVGFPLDRWACSFDRDFVFAHSSEQLNLILSPTDTYYSSALHDHSSSDSFKYESLIIKLGVFVFFNHNDLLHGCKINKIGKLVMSINFRFIPLSSSVLAFVIPCTTVNSLILTISSKFFLLTSFGRD